MWDRVSVIERDVILAGSLRVEEHTISLAEAPVFYRTAGASDVPAIYLHGAPTSSDDWTAFLERTGGIAPDLIGFGRSAKGGNLDYSLRGHARFIAALLDQLGVQRAKLVMHGWGAGGGLVFAQDHPERVERLVLLNALPLLEGFTWAGIARAWRRPLLGELAMGATTRRLLSRLLCAGSARADAWPAERLDAVWQQFDQGTQRALLRLYRDADPERLAQAGAALHTLRAPALVVWGAQDPWLSEDWGRAYAAHLPNAELEVRSGAGHWPWLDDPTVIDLVAGFLAAS